MEITDFDMFDFDDVDTDDSFEDGILNDEVSTHLDSISFGESKSERTLEYDLRQAQKNVITNVKSRIFQNLQLIRIKITALAI